MPTGINKRTGKLKSGYKFRRGGKVVKVKAKAKRKAGRRRKR